MRIACLSLLILSLTAATVAAQDHADEMATVTCAFADGKQISVRYLQPETQQKEIFGKVVPLGKQWKPGGKPILLFTEADLSLDGTAIPAGAYELFPTPDKEGWKLEITRPSGNNESGQKIGSVTLAKGKLTQPLSQFTIYFGRIGERQCSMRMYWGHTGVWAEFQEK